MRSPEPVRASLRSIQRTRRVWRRAIMSGAPHVDVSHR
jgi:hypothetical protein